MKVLGLIPCRGGSKGIPRKNLAPLAGKPLLAWTIEQALAAGCLDRVVVSTEDEEIAAVARKWGAEVPFQRPMKLATDEASPVAVALDALDRLAEQEAYRPDYLMLLQVTSPLREAADLEAAVALARESGGEAVVGVCPAPVHPFLTRRLTADGRLVDFLDSQDQPERRQDFPPAFAIN
ncbi:MAG: acylneuraminate cytidylyltransferase family protein, partial [Deltaproteobacteria bacterium]|nr:acylneuraminate cytidylyltransferase family protein [Deltaproteobacteria bacterium]